MLFIAQGAGDAFIGALAFYKAMTCGLSLEIIIQFASEIAALSCQSQGTQSSFPSVMQLPSHLLESPVQQHK